MSTWHRLILRSLGLLRQHWKEIQSFSEKFTVLIGIFIAINIATSKLDIGNFQYFIPSSQFFYYPDKPVRIFAFVAGVTGVFFAAVYLLNKSRKDKIAGPALRTPWNSRILLTFLVHVVSFLSTIFSLLGIIPLYFGIIPIVVFIVFQNRLLFWKIIEKFGGKIGLSISTVLAVGMGVIFFFPTILLGPLIISDLQDLPGSTHLKSGHIVDDLKYIKENNIIFFHPPYDPRIDGGGDPKNLPEWASVQLKLTKELEQLLAETSIQDPFFNPLDKHTTPIKTEERSKIALRNLKPLPLYYNQETQRLVACEPIDALTLNGKILRDNVLAACAPEERERVNAFFSGLRNKQLTSFSNENHRDFYKNNQHELIWKILNRHVIHHHNFVLGPINEIDLGRSLDQINFQYGQYTSVFIHFCLKTLGPISMDGYHQFMHFVFLAYFVSSIFFAKLIFSSKTLTACFALGYAATLGLMGFEFTLLGPGLNPMRHLFDFVSIGFFCASLRCKSLYSYIALNTVALALCIIGVTFNATTGIPLTASLLVGISLTCPKRSRMENNIWLSMTVAVAIFTLIVAYLTRGSDRLTPYYIQGLIGLPESNAGISFILIGIFATYSILILYWGKIRSESRSTFIVCFCYSQSLLLYYVWGGSRYHFFNFLPVYLLTGLLALKIAHDIVQAEYTKLNKTSFNSLASSRIGRLREMLIASFLALSLAAFSVWTFQFWDYSKTFFNKTSYRWDNPRAQIITTIPEEPFVNSSEIINRYSSDKSIDIISRYDNLIPFLAGKYSSMPMPDIQWFINKEADLNEIVQYIRIKKPKFLFVDTDIDRSHRYEIPSGIDSESELSLKAEAVARYHRLTYIKKSFDLVRGSYRLKEKGELISVWEFNQ